MSAEAYVAIGSNIAPERNVRAAVARLGDEAELVAVSMFYRTRPAGRPEQADYFNGMVRLRTGLAREQVEREVLKKIELELGRERTADRFAARTIDLDLAVYCVEGEAAWVDPEVALHNFVAAPLAELAPGLPLAPDGRTAATIAARLGRGGLEPDEALTRTLKEMVTHEHRPR
jgi:2-amino-4-hydroxy-6-hydroxymethyldihydropteridine diphosphokinase